MGSKKTRIMKERNLLFKLLPTCFLLLISFIHLVAQEKGYIIEN